MGIGWHPYFVSPSGDRFQVRLHLPSETRAVMNNYDDSFITGKRVPVKGTAYDFSPCVDRLSEISIWTITFRSSTTAQTEHGH